MDDEYEFEPPPELAPWFEKQQRKERENKQSGLEFYILENYKIKPASFEEWMFWFQTLENRVIERTDITEHIFVSTIFLGLDHGFLFNKNCKPILFETMVFGGELHTLQWRYSTVGEAKQGHYEIVRAIEEKREPCLHFGEEGFWSKFKDMFDDNEDNEK